MEEVLDGGDWSASGRGFFTTEEWVPLIGSKDGKEEILCLSGIELQYFNRTVGSLATTLTELTRFLLQCSSTVLGA